MAKLKREAQVETITDTELLSLFKDEGDAFLALIEPYDHDDRLDFPQKRALAERYLDLKDKMLL